MKKSNDTIGNRTCDLPTYSAVPQPTTPPRAPARVVQSEKIWVGKIYQFLTGDGNFHYIVVFGTYFNVFYIRRTHTDISCPKICNALFQNTHHVYSDVQRAFFSTDCSRVLRFSQWCSWGCPSHGILRCCVSQQNGILITQELKKNVDQKCASTEVISMFPTRFSQKPHHIFKASARNCRIPT